MSREGDLWHPAALSRNILLALLLFLSWYTIPFTRELWDALDITVYRLCNGSLQGRPLWQAWWAFANTRAFDLVILVIQITFFIGVGPREELGRRVAQFLFLYGFAHAALTLTHGSLSKICDIGRTSPTAALGDGIRLQGLLSWAFVKDASWQSFPGDHCVIVMLWALFSWFFKGRQYGIPSVALALFVTTPRLFSGAHWFTDLAVGGGAITLFLFSLATLTPIHHYGVSLFTAFRRPAVA